MSPLVRNSITVATTLFAFIGGAANAQLPSSAASITVTADHDLFLIADYSNVLLFDRRYGTVATMAVVGASRPNVPTGLAYDGQRQRLFIANYLSNNVLVARVDLPTKTIVVEQEFASDQAISPENVSVDPDSGNVAIADYDGNDIQIWKQSGAAWTRICAVPLKQAHGILLSHGDAFATGLAGRELVKIDPTRCTITGHIGEAGWDPGAYGFLWPTAIAEWDHDNIAVADAHTGMLSIFDRRSLA